MIAKMKTTCFRSFQFQEVLRLEKHDENYREELLSILKNRGVQEYIHSGDRENCDQ